MNCKNSAQNALKVAIFRLKIEKFSAEGAMPPPQTPPALGRGIPLPKLHPLGAFGASILAPAALHLGPPFANPGSATDATCDKNRHRSYLCTACRRCGLKNYIKGCSMNMTERLDRWLVLSANRL